MAWNQHRNRKDSAFTAHQANTIRERRQLLLDFRPPCAMCASLPMMEPPPSLRDLSSLGKKANLNPPLSPQNREPQRRKRRRGRWDAKQVRAGRYGEEQQATSTFRTDREAMQKWQGIQISHQTESQCLQHWINFIFRIRSSVGLAAQDTSQLKTHSVCSTGSASLPMCAPTDDSFNLRRPPASFPDIVSLASAVSTAPRDRKSHYKTTKAAEVHHEAKRRS